jgi:hypothetical protein
MTGGYLQQIVESGTTSLRQVRGSIHGAPPPLDLEEQHTVVLAEPFARDEMAVGSVAALPARGTDVRVGPPASPQLEVTWTERDAVSNAAPTLDVQPLTPTDVHIEGGSHRAASGIRSEAKGTGAPALSLKDAGVRTALLPDEAAAAQSASRQRPRPLGASARSLEQSSPHPRVSAARVEQWQRLNERLLMEHYPATSKSNVVVAAEQHQASHPTNQRAGDVPREIVIEHLEVVVSAPHPAPAAPPVSRSNSSPSRAWSVATRRYLGRL